MQGFKLFVVFCLWVLGTIGSLGFSLYEKAWVIAVGAAFNAVIAALYVWKCYKDYNK